jgi:hypothetical protein
MWVFLTFEMGFLGKNDYFGGKGCFWQGGIVIS